MTVVNQHIDTLIKKDYQAGFITDVEADNVPPGLDEAIIRQISSRKREPAFMLDWRLKAYRHWTTMQVPRWSTVHYPPIDYQSIVYYSAPKSRAERPGSLAEIDPKLLETYKKLGIPLEEQEALAGVAVDASIRGRELLYQAR